jgi:hypothetical protein
MGTISNGAGSIAWSITKCISSECSPANGRGSDDNARRLGELGVSDGRDRSLAERRAPFRRRMNRDARKRDPMSGADDDNAARRLGPVGPRAERRRGDRTRVDEAGMRPDDNLGRNAAIRPSAFAHIRDQGAQRIRLDRIKRPRDLRGMDGLGVTRHGANHCDETVGVHRRQRMLFRDHFA